MESAVYIDGQNQDPTGQYDQGQTVLLDIGAPQGDPNQYADPNQQFVDPNQQFVDPNNQFVDPNQQYEDPNQQFVDQNQPGSFGDPSLSQKDGSLGQISVQLSPDGQVDMQVSPDGQIDVQQTNGSSRPQDIALQPQMSVEGSVVGEDGTGTGVDLIGPATPKDKTQPSSLPPKPDGPLEARVQKEVDENKSLAGTYPLMDNTNCNKCGVGIEAGETGVVAPKISDLQAWHPACFCCSTCDELLVDLVYCHLDGAIYCERHYAELIKPRCAACDEVCVGSMWCVCWGGGGYVCVCVVDLVYCQLDGAIYCERHYAELIKPRCAACDEWDPTQVPPGRYRRGSISHSWFDASVEHSEDEDASPPARIDAPPPDRIHTPQDELIPNSNNGVPSQTYLSRIWINPDGPKSCDQPLIFSGEYTKAMEQDWHSTHFCCFNCDLNLTGHRYILRDEHPYCIKCYENLFANGCEECKTPIGTDSKDLSYKEKHWHEKCFYCSDCRNSLVDQPFASKNEKLFCADCHDNNFAARCDGCQNIFKAGMKKYEYKGKQWHEQCFCCKVCQQPIGSKSFIPRDQEVVCVPCYEEQYAQRCMKCNGVINKGGITYKGTPWHRECFVCTNCTKTLAGEKFTSRDEKPFCAECFGDLFAKKCIRCTKPITGLGGTKFISFEERHWHSDCFVCYRCNVSLVGRGFLTDNTDILCPDCGRA